MKVLAVAGPSDSGKTTVVAELAGRLRERGPVATIKHLTHEPDVDTEGKDTARHRAGGATRTVGITDDEGWFATGEDRSLDDVLDDFAPDHDYAIVEGFSGSGLPKVVLGGREATGPVVATAPDADALDVDAVLEAIEDLPPRETLESLVERARTAVGEEFDGAVATYEGRVDGGESGAVTGSGYTDEALATIREELCDREGIEEVVMHHRPGDVALVVLAEDREAAFAAVSDAIDRTEETVPLAETAVTVGGRTSRRPT